MSEADTLKATWIDRLTTSLAGTSPEGLAPAHYLARVRQGGAAVRR